MERGAGDLMSVVCIFCTVDVPSWSLGFCFIRAQENPLGDEDYPYSNLGNVVLSVDEW
jgi:hypothetical protein